jgi:hypothetical protein
MTGISVPPQVSSSAYYADQGLGRHALLRDHCDGPARWIAGLMLLDRTDHPRDRQSIQHHSRLLAPILGEAATSGLYWVSNFDRLHASPAVAVRETVPRRSARYRATVNNDSDSALRPKRSSQRIQIIRHVAELSQYGRIVEIAGSNGRIVEVAGSRITSATESNLRPQTTCNSLLLIDRGFHISTFGTVASLG